MSKRVSDAELVRALRCISTAGGGNPCSGCCYRTVDDICGYSCDMDQIGLDAAGRLEELTQSIRPEHQLTEVQWETLQVYAECGLSATATSRALHRCYGTILHRMDAIAARTGIDPRGNFYGLCRLLGMRPPEGEW